MVKLLAVVAAIAALHVTAVRLDTVDATMEIDGPEGGDKKKTSLNHTFGDCHCAFTSGNRDSCCAAQVGKGMGTGNVCGNIREKQQTCGGANPVCCTSKILGNMCCPADSTCTGACGGGGGRGGGARRKCKCLPLPTNNSDAVEAFRLPLAKMFAHLAQASYCGPDGFSPNWQNLENWQCVHECKGAGLKLEKGSIRRITRRDKKEWNATFAYVGRFQEVGNGKSQGPEAPRSGDCILGIAGSITDTNWDRNKEFFRKRGEKVLVSMKGLDKKFSFHQGFMQHWLALAVNETEGGVIKALNDLGCGPGTGRRVFPTGQSLGASAAVIAMADLKLRGYKVGLTYVFQSPRVGNSHVMQWFRTAFGRKISLFRMTHGRDPVPRLTPFANGFRAAGAEFYFSQDWDDSSRKELNYVICQDEEDKRCSKRHFFHETFSSGEDHCKNPLPMNGNICALPQFCDNPDDPKRPENGRWIGAPYGAHQHHFWWEQAGRGFKED